MPRERPTPFDQALRFLAARARTRVELDRALARKGYEAGERATALARLAELGYLDDRSVALSRGRSLLSRGQAPRMLLHKLQGAGVGREEAAQALSELTAGQSDRDLALVALQRKLRGRAPRDERERARLFRGLLAKGHRASVVAEVLGMSGRAKEDPNDGGSGEG